MLDDVSQAYIRSKHFPGGSAVDSSKGLFDPKVDLDALVEKSFGSDPSGPNPAGFYERTVNAEKMIGTTSADSGGVPTSWFMLVQDKCGGVITMYPVPLP
jgi:hypothetical protein